MTAAVRAEDLYRATVTTLLGEIDPLEMQVRCELMLVRDRASAALNRAPEEAHPCLIEANRLASLASLSAQSTAALTVLFMAAENMMQAANLIRKANRL